MIYCVYDYMPYFDYSFAHGPLKRITILQKKNLPLNKHAIKQSKCDSQFVSRFDYRDRFLLLFLLHVSIDTPKRCYYMAQKLKNAMNGTDTTDDEVVRETRFYVRSQNSVDHVNHITGVSGECVGS